MHSIIEIQAEGYIDLEGRGYTFNNCGNEANRVFHWFVKVGVNLHAGNANLTPQGFVFDSKSITEWFNSFENPGKAESMDNLFAATAGKFSCEIMAIEAYNEIRRRLKGKDLAYVEVEINPTYSLSIKRSAKYIWKSEK